MQDVWDYDALTTRTVDTHIRRLREKLGPVAGSILKRFVRRVPPPTAHGTSF